MERAFKKEEKKCTRCKTEKSINEFGKNKNTKDGLHWQYKTCRAEDYKKNKERLSANRVEYRKVNKDRLNRINRKYRQDNKEELKEKKRIYTLNNKYKIATSKMVYYQANKERMKKARKFYYQKNKETIREYNRLYNQKNRARIKECSRIYRLNNELQIKETCKIYRKANNDKIRRHHRQYRKKNVEKIREYHRGYYDKQIKVSVTHMLRRLISGQIWSAMHNQQLLKTKSCMKYINYTMRELHDHLELQGYYLLENPSIDHIIPQSLFNFKNEDEVRKCWDLRNLRALDLSENMRKGCRLNIELVKLYGIEDLLPKEIL